MVRKDQSDLIYRTEVAKFDAVVDDIAEKHEKGQPILVGTTSVEKSEYLSQQLSKRGIQHEVLNAKQHDREAPIIAQAGRRGAVTVATNMAGRGTDIKLGGNPDDLAEAELRQRGLDPEEHIEEWAAALPAALEKAEQAVKAEFEEVKELGGLYVLGTERHESRRIDNQLRGRSGRQGDPGESRFYLSTQDDLMRLFGSALAESMMQRFPDDMPLESKIVTRGIASAQGQVESRNFEIRKNVLKYDDVLSRQRSVIYDERRRVLDGEDMAEQIQHFLKDVLTAYVAGATAAGHPDSWDLDGLWTALKAVYPVSITVEEVVQQAGGVDELTHDLILAEVLSDAQHAYTSRETELGESNMRQLERRVVLSVLDRKWREHLYEMDYLKEGIGLRAMAQRDPLVEYQREGFLLFQAMTEAIKEESVGYLFNLEVKVETAPAVTAAGAAAAAGTAAAQALGAAGAAAADTQPAEEGEQVLVAKGLDGPDRQVPLSYTAPSEDGDGAVVTGANGATTAVAAGDDAAGNREERRKAKKKK
jgi:preprotein translocase subunit SecA